MFHPSPRALVVVYGATGFAGRLVCRALRRRDVRFAIAGRDARKLALLAEELGGVEACAVDGSRDSLRRLVDGRLIVCACAGPFADVGHPMLATCAELGVHYVDISDEQPFAAEAFARHDAAARAGKACMVPAMGFGAAPADWAAQLLCERLGGGPIDAIDVAYVVHGPSSAQLTSRGAKRTAVATLARGGGFAHVAGGPRAEHVGAVVRRFETLGSGEVTARSCAGVEAVVVPRHVDAREVRTFRASTPLAARALQVAGALGPLAARIGRGAVDRVLAHVSEGPDPTSRAATRFEIVVRARKGTERARLHLLGHDPYEVTAQIQAHAVDAATRGYVTASGVVAPSVGYHALSAFAHMTDVLQVVSDDAPEAGSGIACAAE
jgi:short subunit dehydrogenase-like uncharacterized protein